MLMNIVSATPNSGLPFPTTLQLPAPESGYFSVTDATPTITPSLISLDPGIQLIQLCRIFNKLSAAERYGSTNNWIHNLHDDLKVWLAALPSGWSGMEVTSIEWNVLGLHQRVAILHLLHRCSVLLLVCVSFRVNISQILCWH